VLPHRLVAPGKGRLLLSLHPAFPRGAKRLWVPLVRALLEAGEGACLTEVLPHLSGCSPREWRALARLVQKHPIVPPAFRQATLDAAALWTGASPWERLRAWWKGKGKG
jgi:hypothetical protein